jgi:Protein of unknown function (DUF1350)
MIKIIFKPIYTCWVAEHPKPVGTIEFLGGALFGILPTIFYSYFLRFLYGQGFTVITSPFRLSLNHTKVTKEIYEDRARVFDTLNPIHENLPHFWIGHSLGCKYIMLLEIFGERDSQDFLIQDQPSILMAPNISDTRKAVKFAWLAKYLDRKGYGVRPNRSEMKSKLIASERFNLSGIISFGLDKEAGNQSQSAEQPDFSDVALITQILASRPNRLLLGTELKNCQHLEPIKISFQQEHLSHKPQRQLENLVLDYLHQLTRRTRVAQVMNLPNNPKP